MFELGREWSPIENDIKYAVSWKYSARVMSLLFFPHRNASKKHNFGEFLTRLKIRPVSTYPITK